VRLCALGERSIGQVAIDLDLTESALRGWVAGADANTGAAKPEVLSSTERQELQQLRRDNKRLLMERDILKKAAAFFAKEST
jgi:transposase